MVRLGPEAAVGEGPRVPRSSPAFSLSAAAAALLITVQLGEESILPLGQQRLLLHRGQAHGGQQLIARLLPLVLPAQVALLRKHAGDVLGGPLPPFVLHEALGGGHNVSKTPQTRPTGNSTQNLTVSNCCQDAESEPGGLHLC